MATIDRLLTNILCSDVAASKDFFTALFDLEVSFDSDWFVQLVSGNLEIGLIQEDHAIVPDSCAAGSHGMYITLVVKNADQVYQKALDNNFEIVKAPHDTFYGQRRLLLKMPDGGVLDVSSVMQ